jgi:hypothetical protein
MKRRALSAGVLALLLAAAFAAPAQAQCAMCRTFLTSSPEGRLLSRALSSGILLMLVAPYLVFGTFVLVFFRHRWQPAVGRLWRRLVPGRVAVSS